MGNKLETNFETLSACPLCGGESITTVDTASNICECAPCGYLFHNPRPAIEHLVAFYSQPAKYDSWLAEEGSRDRLWERRLKLLLPVLKQGSLLDVGTGIGQFLNLARSHFSAVSGTEVSESAIEIARKKYGLNLLRGEISDIDFGSTHFDNITVFHVLEHVPNPRLLLEKCMKLLAPGGMLVIAVPNDLRSLRTRVKRFLGTVGLRRYRNNGRLGLPEIALDGSCAEIHLSQFTPQSLQKLSERCGLAVVWNTLDPYFAASGLALWKHKILYEFCRTLKALLRTNLYDTILVVAKTGTGKVGDRAQAGDWGGSQNGKGN